MTDSTEITFYILIFLFVYKKFDQHFIHNTIVLDESLLTRSLFLVFNFNKVFSALYNEVFIKFPYRQLLKSNVRCNNILED